MQVATSVLEERQKTKVVSDKLATCKVPFLPSKYGVLWSDFYDGKEGRKGKGADKIKALEEHVSYYLLQEPWIPQL